MPRAARAASRPGRDALLALFDSYRQRATPVVLTGPADPTRPADPTDPADPAEPDAEERLLLSLFVAGMPDKAIASQLAVSRRTVQRRLWDLMARAGVDTRPGLAYQAARRGWV